MITTVTMMKTTIIDGGSDDDAGAGPSQSEVAITGPALPHDAEHTFTLVATSVRSRTRGRANMKHAC